MNQKTFGLSVTGSTVEAIATGKAFEKTVESFRDHLNKDIFLFTNNLNELPISIKYGIKQFFALSSKELLSSKPIEPKLGDIVKSDSNGIVETYTINGWKVCKEGILPDHILLCKQTSKAVLIEVKYGDTEGNAHIERAGARATPQFLNAVNYVFSGKVRYLYIFGGPMVTAKHDIDLTPKVAYRGLKAGEVIQDPNYRRLKSIKYRRQIEVLFGSGVSSIHWNTILWDDYGMENLVRLFDTELSSWLTST
jgi:hypothetical protein